MRKNIFFSIALSVCVSSCATHPLPENYAGLNTNAIVYYIRCEARQSISNAIGEYLTTIPHDRAIGAALLDGTKQIDQLRLADLTPGASAAITKYLPAAIAFDFTFDMSVDNNVSTQLDFLDTLTHSTVSLGLNAGSDHQRQTIRNFRTSSTFNDLIGKYSNCGAPRGPNWDYPITGQIGLDEMVRTFVNLNEFEGLTGAAATASVPQLADTLVFQTNLTGSATPKITLNPLKRGTQLSDASITGSVSRKDSHKVIVALSLPPTKAGAVKALSGAFFGNAIGASSFSFEQSSAQVSANALLNDQIQRNIFNNLAVTPSR